MNPAFLEGVFWLGPALVVYAYVAFPLAMSLVARTRQRRARAGSSAVPTTPVTVIIPAYNEERSVGARIHNILAADYPRELIDVLVVSDASTDGTNAIARSFESEGVRLIVQERRSGKTAGLNRAIQIARGDVVVFTDANAAFHSHTIRALVEYFDDTTVGLVSGYTRYAVDAAGDVAEVTNAYTSLERTLKRAESRWGCCVGADGAIFAMRRSLYRTLRDDDINDLVLPLSVIDQGFRCVFAEEAYCSENAGDTLESEFRRQSRITNRSLRAIWRRLHLLDPFRFPAFSFFLASHKVLRFCAPLLLCVSALTLVVLATQDRWYRGVAVTAGLAGVVILGMSTRELPARVRWLRPLRLVNVFVTMNVAMLHGWWKFVSGDAEVTWTHDRVLTRQ
jgi:cellulose synthase/poly-beta-1,6-N-acetylglucosamine synthase-like glycosyltransferase